MSDSKPSAGRAIITRTTVLTIIGVAGTVLIVLGLGAHALTSLPPAPAEQVTGILQSFLLHGIAATVLLIGLGVGLAWYGTRHLVRALRDLSAAAQRAAAGDLDTGVPDQGDDDVGRLGRDFETMRVRLRESREALVRVNADLERKVAERTQHLVGLQEATRRLTANLALEATLDALVEGSRRLFGADRCAVFVRTPESEEIVCLIRHGLSEEYTATVCRNYMQMPGGIARALARPVLVADAVIDPRMAPAADQVRREGFRSILILPFVHHGDVTGAFALYHDQPREYTPDEVSLGEAFAGQAATAIENARLFEIETRRARQLTLIGEIARQAAATLDPEPLLQGAAEALAHAFDYHDVVIFTMDWQAGEVILIHRAGRCEHAVRDFTRLSIAETGIINWVARNGETLLANDVRRDPRYRELLPDTRSELCVPIKDGAQVIAGINVESERLDAFDAVEVATIEALAAELAVALRNARLFAETRRYAEHLGEEVAARTAEIRAQQEHTEAILSSVGDAVIVADPAGRITLANPTARQWLLRAEPELTTLVRGLATSPAPAGIVEIQIGDRVLQSNASRMLADGQLVGTVVVLRDITPLKELDRLKSEFVSNITHELRTPLANIKLYLGLLHKRAAEGQTRYLSVLGREADRLHALIEQLLALSRMELGKSEPQRAPLDLVSLAKLLVSDRQALAAERGLTLSCEVAAACPPALADEALISQVVGNLLSNALNYTLSGGRVVVRVSAAEAGAWVTLAVEDTGVGIPAEEVPHLFERFYRGSSSRETGTPGTGLGLAICREIVDRHAGRIEVHSALGAGSTFTVWLPAVP